MYLAYLDPSALCALATSLGITQPLCGWWRSHSSFCPTLTTEVTVKKWVIRVSFYPEDSQVVSDTWWIQAAAQSGAHEYSPSVHHWWKLCSGLHGSLGTEKTQGFSDEEMLSTCLDFRNVFRETKICIHQSGTQKSSHNPEYENMSRAACKMDLHTSELHIKHSAGHPEVH